MGVKQCHKPPMTGNGNHITYKNSEIGVGLLLLYPHYKRETVVLTPKIRGRFPDFFPRNSLWEPRVVQF